MCLGVRESRPSSGSWSGRKLTISTSCIVPPFTFLCCFCSESPHLGFQSVEMQVAFSFSRQWTLAYDSVSLNGCAFLFLVWPRRCESVSFKCGEHILPSVCCHSFRVLRLGPIFTLITMIPSSNLLLCIPPDILLTPTVCIRFSWGICVSSRGYALPRKFLLEFAFSLRLFVLDLWLECL